MGVSNGNISAPVSIADVKTALSNSSNDLGTLCTRTTINKWSLVKPMYCSGDSNTNSGFYYPLIDTINSTYKQLNGNHRTTLTKAYEGTNYKYDLAYGLNIPNYEDQQARASGNTSNNLMINPSFAARLLKRPDRKPLFYRYVPQEQLVKYRLTDFNNYKHNSDPFLVVKLDYDELNGNIKTDYTNVLAIDNKVDVCNTYSNFKEINTLATTYISVYIESPYSLVNFIKSFFIKNVSDYQYYRAFVAFYRCYLNPYFVGPGEAFWSSFAIRKNNNNVFDWSVTTGPYTTWTTSNSVGGSYPTTMYVYELPNASSASFNISPILASSGNSRYWELIPIFFIKANSEVTLREVYTNTYVTVMNGVDINTISNGVTSTSSIDFTTNIATEECLFPPVGLRRLIKSVSYINPSWFSNYKKNLDARVQIWAGTETNGYNYSDFQNLNKIIHQSDFSSGAKLLTGFGVQIYAYNYKFKSDENTVDSNKAWYVCAPNVNSYPSAGLRLTFIVFMSLTIAGESGVYVSFGKLTHMCYLSGSTMVLDTDMVRKWNGTDMQFNVGVPNHVNFATAYNVNKNSSDAVKACTSSSSPTNTSLYTFPVDSIDLLFEIPVVATGTPMSCQSYSMGGLGTFAVYALTSISVPSSVEDMDWLKNRQNKWIPNGSINTVFQQIHTYTNITEAFTMSVAP